MLCKTIVFFFVQCFVGFYFDFRSFRRLEKVIATPFFDWCKSCFASFVESRFGKGNSAWRCGCHGVAKWHYNQQFDLCYGRKKRKNRIQSAGKNKKYSRYKLDDDFWKFSAFDFRKGRVFKKPVIFHAERSFEFAIFHIDFISRVAGIYKK